MLFIDANAYLEFYGSSKGTIKKLLPTIEEIKDEIFVSDQVVFEVKRNRVNIISNSLRDFLDKCKLNGISLPEHLEDDLEEEIAAWNKSFSGITKQVESRRNSLSQLVENTISKVQKGKDAVSNTLEMVFVNSASPTIDELTKARLRKEIGNPPGKQNDPLGDQISWEQLLSQFDGNTPLWIISSDNDYSSLIDKKRFLNAYLYDELCKAAGKEVKVHIFESLAEGLKHYSDNRPEPVKELPSEDDLRQITSEEALQKVSFAHSSVFPDPIACFKCGKSAGFNGPVPKPSKYGGWTYQWMCNECGEWHDFGEPYDD